MSTAATIDPFKKTIHTAACLVIGDEVLNGKTADTNSAFFAKYCFDLGIDLKRIEVIPDDEAEIVEASRRMSAAYDFVITSGGIGPTHDDITYPSLATAFSSPLALHSETVTRMREIMTARPNTPPLDWDTPSAALTARLRMATLPSGPGTKALFVVSDLWVPIAVVNYNVHVLPGVPRLFVKLLEALRGLLICEGRVDHTRKAVRVLISTPLPESEIAEFLTKLQERVKEKGVKIGSYPRWGRKRNTITLVGSDVEFVESLVEEVVRGTKGERIGFEGEDEEKAGGKEVDVMEDIEPEQAREQSTSRALPEQQGLVDAIGGLKVGE